MYVYIFINIYLNERHFLSWKQYYARISFLVGHNLTMLFLPQVRNFIVYFLPIGVL